MNVDDYKLLITSEHRPRPKFSATVEGVVSPVVSAQQAMAGLPTDFDLDVAVGVQLDVVGEWVGISRYISIPLSTPWFSFGVEGRGWGEGIWKGPLSATKGIQALDDATYRDLIIAKIAANHWDGTSGGVKNVLDLFYFSRGIDLQVCDMQDMSVIYLVPGKTPNNLILSIMAGAYIPVKSIGVRTNYILPSISETPVFGFGFDDDKIAGWGTGSWGVKPDYFLE